ncbi:hypothetical protein SO802_035310 [Lithocarpus litseifolius]|uniref:Secreted protein n=1 Tax=Lithocarpus litseifolius TaxID=425828 RepID=A0AAW2BFA6_9ROSI
MHPFRCPYRVIAYFYFLLCLEPSVHPAEPPRLSMQMPNRSLPGPVTKKQTSLVGLAVPASHLMQRPSKSIDMGQERKRVASFLVWSLVKKGSTSSYRFFW